jgi:hypothetical protein
MLVGNEISSNSGLIPSLQTKTTQWLVGGVEDVVPHKGASPPCPPSVTIIFRFGMKDTSLMISTCFGASLSGSILAKTSLTYAVLSGCNLGFIEIVDCNYLPYKQGNINPPPSVLHFPIYRFWNWSLKCWSKVLRSVETLPCEPFVKKFGE